MAEGFRERFEAEIDSLKKLDHPGIVHLYGYGEQDGILFYSMELVTGTSLEEEIHAGRRFDWHETLQIGIQICRALKHAHDHGVVHRDIKPANLMLTPSGQVKIADFGIARLFGGTQLTTAGGVLGTADYMSPEQADGRAVTESCDQYSLGGVLYAMLAGRPPFRAKTMPEMLQMQRFAAPEPVSRYAPDTPTQFERLLAQLLAKAPADRFPNVLVLGRHMEAMAKALSRPVESADHENSGALEGTNSSAITGDSKPEDLPTQSIESVASRVPDSGAKELSPRVADALTLAQPNDPDAAPQPEPTAPEVTSGPETEPRPTRFTTIDEEASRRREAARENRLALVAQLAALAVSVGVLIGGGWYLTRPESADELLAAIHSNIEKKGTDDLRHVADQLKDFTTRFPHDPRAAELDIYQQQLELQRFDRRIRARARLPGEQGLSPVESIYLQAMAQAEDDPGEAAARLRALVILYDPHDTSLNPQTKDTDGDQRLLIAARQQISELGARAEEEARSELPALRTQMAAAAQLQQSDQYRAVQMYQAIVKLYGEKSWAEETVAEARKAVELLQPIPDTN